MPSRPDDGSAKEAPDGQRSRRGPAARYALLAAIALVGLVAGARAVRLRGQRQDGGTTAASPSPSFSPTPEAESEDWLPSRNAYAGSQRCQECHEKNHARWSREWHSKALAPAVAGFVAGEFGGVHYKGASSEAWMRRDGGRYVVRTRDRDGRLGDHDVAWVIGGKRMQDPVTILPDGRWQVLPVYFHVTTKEWVDYNEAKQGVVTPDHPFFWTNFRRTANRECLDCHVTGLDVRYDRQTHRWTTSFTEAGVACESCHGPGARHAETKSAADIVHPRRVGAERGLAICAQCHGPREPLFPILDSRHRFRPGDRYEDRYDVFVVTDGRERSADFFADGRPKSSSFEYQALLQSQCHLKGHATCLTCHTAPHADHGPDDLEPARAGSALDAGDATCRSCHGPVVAAGEAHTHHRGQEAMRCLACHMPRIIPGVLDLFADHSIDVPVPENTSRHGVPNACNACHVKDTPEAMAQAIRTWWPHASERQQRRLRIADAFDEATAGQSQAALEAVMADASEAPSLRGAAALLLAGRFPGAASSALRPLLRSPAALLRARGATGLALARSSDEAPALIPLLHDPNLQVRKSAAVALESLGSADGEAVLRALADDPATEGLVEPHVELGLAAARRGQWAAAEAELTRSLVLRPYNSAALVALADVQARLGKWERVRADVEEALRFDPQNAAALRRFEFFKRARGNPRPTSP